MKNELVEQPTKRTARKVRNAAWSAVWIAPASNILATLAVAEFPKLEPSAMQVELLATSIITGAGTWIVGYYTRERRENMF